MLYKLSKITLLKSFPDFSVNLHATTHHGCLTFGILEPYHCNTVKQNGRVKNKVSVLKIVGTFTMVKNTESTN